MNFLLFPVGSHGDVHPFLGLALRLKQRGHQVTIVTSVLFQELIERCDIPFRELGTRSEAQELLDDPDLWHPLRAAKVLARKVLLPVMRQQFEIIRELKPEPGTVLIGTALGMGVRMAHEIWKYPFLTVHLQPAVLWSAQQSPRLSRFAWMGDRVPGTLRNLQYRWAAYWMLDRHVKQTVNHFRRQAGLGPCRSVVELFHSPQAICGLFPEWFAAPQSDWPPQTWLAGFPLWDEQGVTPLSNELQAFLKEGTPPIVFTPGTAHTQAGSFWRAAIGACQILGRRGLLMTRHRAHLPAHLPEGIRHFEFAPFSQLLPEAAAILHHGGIGTLSQALRAGIPQVITPMAYDQPDNAWRAEQLGVARVIWPGQLNARRLAKTLQQLFEAPETGLNCAQVQRRFDREDGLGRLADWLEKFAVQTPRSFSPDTLTRRYDGQ